MGNITDEQIAEAHGWNQDRPRLSEAEAKKDAEIERLTLEVGRLKHDLNNARASLTGFNEMDRMLKRAGEMLRAIRDGSTEHTIEDVLSELGEPHE